MLVTDIADIGLIPIKTHAKEALPCAELSLKNEQGPLTMHTGPNATKELIQLDAGGEPQAKRCSKALYTN